MDQLLTARGCKDLLREALKIIIKHSSKNLFLFVKQEVNKIFLAYFFLLVLYKIINYYQKT